ncbi:MAG TPA: hypothetical protein DIW30_04690 [Bacteroidales bacterium]|nr:hypothetical protein [Bacteroidales bacterium]
MKKVLFCIIVLCALASCKYIRQHQAGEAVVTVNGHSLYANDLAAITAGAVSTDDSAAIADKYIRQWASDILLYNKAKRTTENAPATEALVEDYRRTLYVHEYEQYLVDTRMPKQIEEDSIGQFYQRHSERFVLREDILRGMFISLPQDAPRIEELRQWMEELTDENMEKIEKYAYQYAASYELFSDQWQTLHNVMLLMPTDSKDVAQEIRQKGFVQYQDSVSLYLLRITDRHSAGEPMPLDYAQPEIEKVLLNRRQVNFLKQQKEEMYQQAIRQGKIVFNRNTETDNETE